MDLHVFPRVAGYHNYCILGHLVKKLLKRQLTILKHVKTMVVNLSLFVGVRLISRNRSLDFQVRQRHAKKSNIYSNNKI